jgi:hypothetical protein
VPKKFTLREAASALRKFDRESRALYLRVADAGSKMAVRLSVTKYMEGKGSGKNASPANPPPGPLGIRSGDLRRTVKIIPARYRGSIVHGGIAAGSPKVLYARIHEQGGTIHHPGSVGKLQVFQAGGKTIFATRTKPHAIRIPARPYLRPAALEAQPWTVRQMKVELSALATKVIG